MITHLRFNGVNLKYGDQFLTKYNPYTYYYEFFGSSGKSGITSPVSLDDSEKETVGGDFADSNTVSYVKLVGNPAVTGGYKVYLNDMAYLKEVDLSNNVTSEGYPGVTCYGNTLRNCPLLTKVNMVGVGDTMANYILDSMNHSSTLHYTMSGSIITKDTSFTPFDSGDYNPFVVNCVSGDNKIHLIAAYKSSSTTSFTVITKYLIIKYTNYSGTTTRYWRYPVIYVPSEKVLGTDFTAKIIPVAGAPSSWNTEDLSAVTSYDFKTIAEVKAAETTSSYYTVYSEPDETITVDGKSYTAICSSTYINNSRTATYPDSSIYLGGLAIKLNTNFDGQMNILL